VKHLQKHRQQIFRRYPRTHPVENDLMRHYSHWQALRQLPNSVRFAKQRAVASYEAERYKVKTALLNDIKPVAHYVRHCATLDHPRGKVNSDQ